MRATGTTDPLGLAVEGIQLTIAIALEGGVDAIHHLPAAAGR